MSRRIVYVAVALATIWVLPTDAAFADSLGASTFGVVDQPPLASPQGQLAVGLVIFALMAGIRAVVRHRS